MNDFIEICVNKKAKKGLFWILEGFMRIFEKKGSFWLT